MKGLLYKNLCRLADGNIIIIEVKYSPKIQWLDFHGTAFQMH